MGWLLLWCLFGLAAALVVGSKGGNGCLWFVLGVLFGPFALLLALFDQGTQKQCRACKKFVDGEATRCPYCQSAP